MNTPENENSESITAPVASLGGAKVGDSVTFTVDSINGDTASLSPSMPEESDEGEAPAGAAMSQAAKLFDGGE